MPLQIRGSEKIQVEIKHEVRVDDQDLQQDSGIVEEVHPVSIRGVWLLL